MITTIVNLFTGYSASIRTNGTPAISTLKNHLRKSKASDCKSVTKIYIDGVGYDVVGNMIIRNGDFA